MTGLEAEPHVVVFDGGYRRFPTEKDALRAAAELKAEGKTNISIRKATK